MLRLHLISTLGMPFYGVPKKCVAWPAVMSAISQGVSAGMDLTGGWLSQYNTNRARRDARDNMFLAQRMERENMAYAQNMDLAYQNKIYGTQAAALKGAGFNPAGTQSTVGGTTPSASAPSPQSYPVPSGFPHLNFPDALNIKALDEQVKAMEIKNASDKIDLDNKEAENRYFNDMRTYKDTATGKEYTFADSDEINEFYENNPEIAKRLELVVTHTKGGKGKWEAKVGRKRALAEYQESRAREMEGRLRRAVANKQLTTSAVVEALSYMPDAQYQNLLKTGRQLEQQIGKTKLDKLYQQMVNNEYNFTNLSSLLKRIGDPKMPWFQKLLSVFATYLVHK